jgi:3-(3-hydroxy-phenyl)propionate hydroxylase
LVNSGRLSLPCVYDHSPLITPDALRGPSRSRPCAPCCDVALQDGYLLQQLGGGFALLWINIAPPSTVQDLFPTIGMVALRTGDDPSGALQDRYLGTADRAVYLIRPDQHIAARWSGFDPTAVHRAHQRALAKEPETWR